MRDQPGHASGQGIDITASVRMYLSWYSSAATSGTIQWWHRSRLISQSLEVGFAFVHERIRGKLDRAGPLSYHVQLITIR